MRIPLGPALRSRDTAPLPADASAGAFLRFPNILLAASSTRRGLREEEKIIRSQGGRTNENGDGPQR